MAEIYRNFRITCSPLRSIRSSRQTPLRATAQRKKITLEHLDSFLEEADVVTNDPEELHEAIFKSLDYLIMVDSEERNKMVRNEFLNWRRTIPTEKRNYEEWHRNRREYAVWTIGIRSQPVESRFDAARAHLSEFLLEPYRRQAHVTLFVCGFLAEVEQFDDDYAVEKSADHLRQLQKAKIAPFEIGIGGISSFAAAPFDRAPCCRREQSLERTGSLERVPICSGGAVRLPRWPGSDLE